MFLQSKKKKKIKTEIIRQILISLIGLFIIFLISIPLAKKITKQYRVNNEMRELENEISGLQKKNEELKNVIDYLKTDEYVKNRAKLDLNFREEGEEVVVVKDLNIVENETTDEIISIDDKIAKDNNNLSNPQKWLNYFINKK